LHIDPQTGIRKLTPGQSSILCICFYDPVGIVTVRENIGAWQKASAYAIEVLNLWPGGYSSLTIPSSVNLARYDAIYIHPTACYNPENLWSLDSLLNISFSEYHGTKIIAKQDEHYKSAITAKYIGSKKFDLVLTCLDAISQVKVYPREIVGDCQFYQTLTGYVSHAQRDLVFKPLAERPIDVGYRGSMQPLSFGRLGREKWEIGERFQSVAPALGLTTNISSEWSARFNGSAWYDFLQSIRAVLGVESGSNVFDFDGSIAADCDAFRAAVGDSLSREELYNHAETKIIGSREGNVDYAQVSPRHFEAAAAYTVQVLYEGRYSGILQPWRHFVPLRRDFGNIEEIAAFLRDDALMTGMAVTARAELIDAPTYHYETFIADLDDVIGKAMRGRGNASFSAPLMDSTDGAVPTVRGGRKVAADGRSRAIILAAHEPKLDPRLDWFADSLAEDFNVCEIGTYPWAVVGDGPSLEKVAPNRLRLRVERTKYAAAGLAPFPFSDKALAKVALAWSRLDAVLTGVGPDVIEEYGLYAKDALPRVRGLATYFMHTTSSLVEAGRRLGGADIIVAADLETLLAGVILSYQYGARLIYDAHEYWPFSYIDFSAAETQFWCEFEAILVSEASLRLSVSPPLAALLTDEYGSNFVSVPNAVPRTASQEIPVRPPLTDGFVDFLVQGNFTEGRGYEELIDSWAATAECARLVLRGPDNPYRQSLIARAQQTGLLDKRILFPDAVSEHQLVKVAAQSSVGVIPYKPSNPNYRSCCPNKLSQYMASGLPILANYTEFVGPFVRDNGIGAVCDFADTRALASAVTRFVNDVEFYRACSERAYAVFNEEFHWESVFLPVKEFLGNKGSDSHSYSPFDVSWVGEPGIMDTVRALRHVGGLDYSADYISNSSLIHRFFGKLKRINILKVLWRRLPIRLRGIIVDRVFSKS